MDRKNVFAVLSILFAGCTASYADSAPLGILNAYDLVALGTTGANSIAGNIVGPTTSDSEGRIAAAGQITYTLNVGNNLGSDPWGSLANNYAVVAGGGVNVTPADAHFTINGGGGVWASSNNAGYYFNDGKKLTVGGASPIDFASERIAMQSLNTNLSTLASNGTMGAVSGGNPSWTGLYGTSSTLNVFTLTAVQFGSDDLDFIVPQSQSGATIIVNVLGAKPVLNNALMINGVQESDSNDDNNRILFNFEDASSVTINAQFNAALLAPNATLSGNAQMGGNFIVAAVGQTGEVHNDEFVGAIPQSMFQDQTPAPVTTPEPATLVLMGTGGLFLAGLVHWRIRA